MNNYRIPFNKATLVGNELDYVQEAFNRGHISGDGHFSKKCSALLENVLGVPRVLLTTSCTHALEMAALLCQLKPDDEVIVPTFTFVSTVNAFVLAGARPVFADIRSDTLNMDEQLLEKAISPKTRAIVPVHYAGVGCEMNIIFKLADDCGVQVIEDNAHGLFGKYQDRNLGALGSLAALSFHETKNFTCGEGGALILNDPKLIERAEIIREKGTDRSKYFRGQVDKYTWVDLGSSYLLSDILAAMLYAQLLKKKTIQARRKAIWQYYFENLKNWALERQIGVPYVPSHCEQAFHLFYLIMPSKKMRDAFINYTKRKGILTVFHYVPLHLSPMGRKYGAKPGDCPVAENMSDRLVRLPFYYALNKTDQAYIVTTIRAFNY